VREQRAVLPNQRDPGVQSERRRAEEVLEISHRHRAEQQPHELAVGIVEAPRDIDVPGSAAAILHRRADEALEVGIVLSAL